MKRAKNSLAEETQRLLFDQGPWLVAQLGHGSQVAEPGVPGEGDSIEELRRAQLEEELQDCQWRLSVALDPKHRPQVWDEPSGTVRREWCRYPQEAHLLDEREWRYRRLSVDEIAIIQGFEPCWFDVPNITRRNRIRGIGDAVPPPLARAVVGAIDSIWTWRKRTAVEICAGAGGLASGALGVEGMEHLLLVDQWPPACEILRHQKPWRRERVMSADIKQIDVSALRRRVGLLSGGPPCQPWSQGGRHLGAVDPRDLLGSIDELVGAIEPEVFIFENVPGLVTDQNIEYLHAVLNKLRRPGGRSGPKYGVIAGILNAADYGVPQIRRRVFMLGLLDAPAALAYRIFDRIYERATHRDPAVPHPNRARWVTLREALRSRQDPGGWRRWIDLPGTTLIEREPRYP